MNTQIINITPALAEEWIKKNTNNIRKVDYRKVDTYAGMMSRGTWPTTHQGIAFDEFDQLIDGQHRLLAIIKSGATIRCLVAFGVQSEAVSVIDRGLRRSAAVVLGEDKRTAEIICFIARILYSSDYADDELIRVCDSIRPYCNQLLAACGTSKKALTATSVRAAFVTSFIQTGDIDILTNYRRFVLVNLADIEAVNSTPISLRVLHNRLVSSTLRITPLETFAYTYRAISNLETKKVSINEDQMKPFLATIRKFYREKFNL